jgi:hypothetical protein
VTSPPAMAELAGLAADIEAFRIKLADLDPATPGHRVLLAEMGARVTAMADRTGAPGEPRLARITTLLRQLAAECTEASAGE